MLIHEMLARAVKYYRHHPAVVDGEVRMTYGEVNARVHQLAAALQGLGLGHGEHAAILAHNSFRYMETYLAASPAGIVLAPINTRLSPAETAFILNDGAIKVLLLERSFLPTYEQIRGDLTSVEQVVLLDGPTANGLHGYEALLEAADPAAVKPRAWRKEDMLFLCYTGGTTGLPKGVMLSQKNAVANVFHCIQLAEFNDRDVWLHGCPMFHAADSWASYVFTMLGAVHVFMDRFDPRAALRLIQEHRVTATLFVPTMINLILAQPDAADYDLSSMRRLLFGASPMPAERLKAAFELFGPILQQAYGQTETSPILTYMPLGAYRPDGSPADLRRLASCGQQVPGVEIRVVNGEGADVAPGEAGEVIARGPNVMLGYWNRPEETAATLVDGWIRTGDVATVDEDNYLYIVDRTKDMIITGGENVYSTEVEDAIYRHPAVAEAAVIGIPDETWGEAIKALVVVREGDTLSAAELIAHCHGLIGAYKCPKSVEFLTELPKSGAGKILKSELRKPFWEGKERAVN